MRIGYGMTIIRYVRFTNHIVSIGIWSKEVTILNAKFWVIVLYVKRICLVLRLLALWARNYIAFVNRHIINHVPCHIYVITKSTF